MSCFIESRVIAGLLLACAVALAQDVRARAHVGYKVVDLATGATVEESCSGCFFTPASNAKLYTTAWGLETLGPGYRFTTELRADGSDLLLVGGGDPNLSGRTVPYQVDSQDGDPLTAFRGLAGQLVNRGIREIHGDVIGVATRYPRHFFPDGWAVDDTLYGFGAPVSALTFSDNTVSLLLHPGAPGELVDLQLRPAVPHLVILNNVVAAATTELHVARQSNELVIWGTVASGSDEVRADVAVDDPALFAAEAMVSALQDAGIKVDGEADAKYCDVPNTACASNSGAASLATHVSAPLCDVIQVINKASQNLHAEMLLQETGLGGDPLASRSAYLTGFGISDFVASDGSGLARQDLATPDSTVALLAHMWNGPQRDVWLQSLPVGGVDGTLQHRFQGIAGADRIHAKTGSLGHVNTLSGYIERKNGGWLAFSVMVDETDADDHAVRSFIDQFCGALLQQ